MTTATERAEEKHKEEKEEKEIERLNKLTPEERHEEEVEKLIKEEQKKMHDSWTVEKGVREQAAKENEEKLRATNDVKPERDFNSPESVKTREELARKQSIPQQHARISENQRPGMPTLAPEKSGALSSANEDTASKLDRIALVLKNSGADSMGQIRGLAQIKEILGY